MRVWGGDGQGALLGARVQHGAGHRGGSASVPSVAVAGFTATELLVRLIRTPSVSPSYDTASPSEDAVGYLIAELASSLGLEVQRDEVVPGRHNVLATLRSH